MTGWRRRREARLPWGTRVFVAVVVVEPVVVVVVDVPSFLAGRRHFRLGLVLDALLPLGDATSHVSLNDAFVFAALGVGRLRDDGWEKGAGWGVTPASRLGTPMFRACQCAISGRTQASLTGGHLRRVEKRRRRRMRRPFFLISFFLFLSLRDLFEARLIG